MLRRRSVRKMARAPFLTHSLSLFFRPKHPCPLSGILVVSFCPERNTQSVEHLAGSAWFVVSSGGLVPGGDQHCALFTELGFVRPCWLRLSLLRILAPPWTLLRTGSPRLGSARTLRESLGSFPPAPHLRSGYQNNRGLCHDNRLQCTDLAHLSTRVSWFRDNKVDTADRLVAWASLPKAELEGKIEEINTVRTPFSSAVAVGLLMVTCFRRRIPMAF